MDKIMTIGVYGFDEDSFFRTIIAAQIDIFCDIRLRRGMRGSEYAFVNSERLQSKLRELGIRYIHVKDLAPSKAIREKQKREDEKLGIAKRRREVLGETFVYEYEQECLSHFDSATFCTTLGQAAHIIGLFCVERDPRACHRSLVANRLSADLRLPIEHMTSSLSL